MNTTQLIGRLTRDVELRHTQSGTAVANITLAINRPKREGQEQEADFISIVIWGKQAENAQKYLAKGSQIAVEGRIQTRHYDNNEGKRVYVTEVVAHAVHYLSHSNNNSNNQQQPHGEDYDNFPIINDDDLPF